MDFLPVCKKDLEKIGVKECDFIVVTGDAYVDHPSFGAAIIARLLQKLGYIVAIIAQPDYKTPEAFKIFRRPKIGFMVTSGSIDSMVSNYTVSKKVRSDDVYSPGSKGFKRPDRALIVYCNKIREAYFDVPIIIGGLEASLRRFAHYDYWSDKVRRSIILDSQADLLIYGMAEKQIFEIDRRLKDGESIKDMTNIRGTAVLSKQALAASDTLVYCQPFETVSADKKAYAASFKIQYDNHDPIVGKTVVQKHGKRFVVQNPPMPPLTTKEMDMVYALPYMRSYHPMYEKNGGVPAIKEVEFSITLSRGCFGACNFCSLAFHQGKMISARSQESVIAEAESFLKNPRFKGYISDVGGPTANFTKNSCKKQTKHGMCKDKRCLAPDPCENLDVTHKWYHELLTRLRKIKGIKKVFIRSGIRFDYLMLDKDTGFFEDLVKHHISGQLKVAPEHCSNRVLAAMGKPEFGVYERFYKKYNDLNKKFKKTQFLVPYLMSSHPASEMEDAIALAQYLNSIGYTPRQVQDFYPTPGTVSTTAYYTGIDPMTNKEIYVAKDYGEKNMQRALLQFKIPKNKETVLKALKLARRADLIGNKAGCLVSEEKGSAPYGRKSKKTTLRRN